MADGLNLVSVIVICLTAATLLLSVIFSGLSYSKVTSNGFCDNDASVDSCTFTSVDSAQALAPTCGQPCQSYDHSAAGVAAYNSALLSYTVGALRSVYNEETMNHTLLSFNHGAVNLMEQVLCNLTALTNVSYTILQYIPPNFDRIVTTVRLPDGANSECIDISSTTAPYEHLIVGEPWQGPVTLFGRDYYSIYIPVFDAITKSLIGGLFTGVPT